VSCRAIEGTAIESDAAGSSWIYLIDGLTRIPASVCLLCCGESVLISEQAFFAEKAWLMLGRPIIIGAIMLATL
jgi:hypothetical protein